MTAKRFTMIELLMVIAIIAVLASMLLPLLQRAGDRAREIACFGNLRQIGIAHSLYCMEWDSTPAVSANGQRWVDALEPLLANKRKDSSGNVWVCPGDTRSDKVKVVYGGKDDNKLSYGINQCYSPGNETAKAYKLWYGVSTSTIKNPAEFIVVADAGAYYIGTTIAAPIVGELNGEVAVVNGFCKNAAIRHGQGRRMNMVFGDGHVTGLRFESIPDRYWDLCNDGSGYRR